VPLAFLTDGITNLVLPVQLGGDVTALGLISFVGLGAGAAIQPAAGWLGDRLRDRVDRRWLAVAAVIPAIAGLVLLARGGGLAAVAGSYLVVQLSAAAIQASQQTLIPEHLTTSGRGRASGIKAAADVGGSFVAFLVLGALLARGDVGGAAVVVGVVLLVATFAMVALVPRGRAPAAGSPAATLSALTVPGRLVPLIVARFLFLLGTYTVGRFLVPLVADRLAVDVDDAAGRAGALLALLALGTAVAALAAGWLADRRDGRDLMAAGAAIGAAGVLGLIPSAGLAGLLVGGLAMSIGTALFVTANWAATAAAVPREAAGRLMGIANLGTALAAALAGLAALVIDAVGYAPALVLAAVTSAAAALPVLLRRSDPATAPRATS
jgi:MFS family permease